MKVIKKFIKSYQQYALASIMKIIIFKLSPEFKKGEKMKLVFVSIKTEFLSHRKNLIK